MTINVTAQRPKAASTANLPLVVEATLVEDDVNNKIFVPLKATNLTVPNFAVAGAVTVSGSNIVNTTGDGFVNVKVGDTYAAATGVTAGAVVEKISNNQIRIGANATAAGTISLTFSPVDNNINLALAGIEIQLISAVNGSITVAITGHKYDGSVQDSPTTVNSATQVNLNQFDIDLDSIFNTARIPRSN